MSGAGTPPQPTTSSSSSWRAVAVAAVALWLVPAVLALAVLWLPLLCCAVAAVRFLRVRRKLVAANATSRRSSLRGGCYVDDGDGDGDRGQEERTVMDGGGTGGRLRLLNRYLDDQVELVVRGGNHDEQERGSQLRSC